MQVIKNHKAQILLELILACCAAKNMGNKGGFLRYADGVDKLLLFFGTLGCIGDGIQTPLTMLVLGSLIDDYARGGSEHIVSIHNINKVISTFTNTQ